jgi:hypothetical protein
MSFRHIKGGLPRDVTSSGIVMVNALLTLRGLQ